MPVRYGKVGNKWVVRTPSGVRGTHDSEEAARRQAVAIKLDMKRRGEDVEIHKSGHEKKDSKKHERSER